MINEKFSESIQKSDIITLKNILDTGELPNIDVNDDEHVYIYMAIIAGDLDVLKLLVSYGADVHADDMFGMFLAIIHSRYDIAKYILDSVDKISVEIWDKLVDTVIDYNDDHMKEIVFNWVRVNVNKIDDGSRRNIIKLLLNRKYGLNTNQ